MKVDTGNAIRKQVRKLPKQVQQNIKALILELQQLESTNEIQSEKLSGTKNRYKIRVGNYRIVYEKITATHIEVTSVRDRKDVHNKLFGIVLSL